MTVLLNGESVYVTFEDPYNYDVPYPPDNELFSMISNLGANYSQETIYAYAPPGIGLLPFYLSTSI